MSLTYNKLIRFDLLNDIEKSLMTDATPLIDEYFPVREEIQGVDQFIKDAPSFPGSTHKIIRSEMMSGIGATLAIEGTTLTNEEMEESFRKADLNEALEKKEQEAENSRKVYRFVDELIQEYKQEFAYSEQTIKQIHKYFTDNMNYPGNTPGDYRGEFSVTFGFPRRSSLCRNRAEVEEAMKKLIDWLNNKEEGPLVGARIPKAIMAHYYLTEIHPFGDGNGRMARAAEALVLYHGGINRYCFWALANFWSANRTEYIAHLGNIGATCDPWKFIIWGMGGYLAEIKRIKKRVLTKVKKLMLNDYVRYLYEHKKTQEIKINRRIVNLVKLLVHYDRTELRSFFGSPEIVAMYSNVSSTTRWRDFNKLLQIGLVSVLRENDKDYVEPNFKLLDDLRYAV